MLSNIIRLDWFIIKYFRTKMIIIPIILIFFGISMPVMVIPLAVWAMLAFSVNAFAAEEKGRTDQLYLTLPITRAEIVNGRYLFSLLCLAGAFVVSVPFAYFMNGLGIMAPPIEGLAESGVLALITSFSFGMYGLIHLMMFPILFRIGYTKGRIWGYYLPIFFVAGFTGSMGFVMSIAESDILHIAAVILKNPPLYCALSVAAGVALLALSYVLSLRFFKRRDL
jgi:ABC-type transport system involved in multi-copper enzyme maturation permease subunit